MHEMNNFTSLLWGSITDDGWFGTAMIFALFRFYAMLRFGLGWVYFDSTRSHGETSDAHHTCSQNAISCKCASLLWNSPAATFVLIGQCAKSGDSQLHFVECKHYRFVFFAETARFTLLICVINSSLLITNQQLFVNYLYDLIDCFIFIYWWNYFSFLRNEVKLFTWRRSVH